MRTSIGEILATLTDDKVSQARPAGSVGTDLQYVEKLAAAVDYALGNMDQLVDDGEVSTAGARDGDRVRAVLHEKVAARAFGSGQSLVQTVMQKLADSRVDMRSAVTDEQTTDEESSERAAESLFGEVAEDDLPSDAAASQHAPDATVNLSTLLSSALGIGGLDDESAEGAVEATPSNKPGKPTATNDRAETGAVRANGGSDLRGLLVSKLRSRLAGGA